MKLTDPKIAAETAQENADYFQVPFVVFRDTSGALRVERETLARLVDGQVYYPHAKGESHD